MITLCKIDGKSYDDLVSAIEETYNIVEGPNSGTAIHKDREIRDITGIKIGHQITFSAGENPDKFDELKNYLFGSVRPFVMLEAVHDQKTITYEAAYNTGSRRVAYINDAENESGTDFVGWDDLTIDFRPMENQISPEE